MRRPEVTWANDKTRSILMFLRGISQIPRYNINLYYTLRLYGNSDVLWVITVMYTWEHGQRPSPHLIQTVAASRMLCCSVWVSHCPCTFCWTLHCKGWENHSGTCTWSGLPRTLQQSKRNFELSLSATTFNNFKSSDESSILIMTCSSNEFITPFYSRFLLNHLIRNLKEKKNIGR